MTLSPIWHCWYWGSNLRQNSRQRVVLKIRIYSQTVNLCQYFICVRVGRHLGTTNSIERWIILPSGHRLPWRKIPFYDTLSDENGIILLCYNGIIWTWNKVLISWGIGTSTPKLCGYTSWSSCVNQLSEMPTSTKRSGKPHHEHVVGPPYILTTMPLQSWSALMEWVVYLPATSNTNSKSS